MTRDELKQYNGLNGAKTYVAYNNNVYDVSQSPMWKDGNHQGMHTAGMDLTAMMENAPHSDNVFANFEIVGTLDGEVKAEGSIVDEPLKAKLRAWYKKYHPHPMIAHFPIVLHLLAMVLDVIFLIEKKEIYALGVYYSFFAATVFGFIAMVPGFLSWWTKRCG